MRLRRDVPLGRESWMLPQVIGLSVCLIAGLINKLWRDLHEN